MADAKPFVKVTWLDASDPVTDASWYTEDEVLAFGESLCEVVSFGYVVSRTKLYLTLAADLITKGSGPRTVYGRITKIPIGMIASEETLIKEPEP